MSDQFTTSTVGELVAADFRRAEIFERFGIDFCCGGRRLLADACRAAAADPTEVIHALETLRRPDVGDDDVTRWPIPRLIDHIVSVHHAYVRSALPVISQHLSKLISAHGPQHAELLRVGAYFSLLSTDLQQHLRKEEHVLFPYVRDLATQQGSAAVTQSPFGTVENPIRMMEREHSEAGDAMRIIRELTHGYSTPQDGCTTYGTTMAELQHFESDLHRHVHLENNVLFPAAVRLERQLGGSMEA
jgi:regulator of cell morphogenesis and NO signaling